MVSQGSPSNPNSHNLHQFLVLDSNSCSNQFENQHFHSYGAGSSYPHSLGLLPSIQSLGDRMSRSIDLVHAPLMAEELNHSRQFLGVSNESYHPQERLSLSLDSGMLVPPVQYRQRSLIPNDSSQSYLFSGEETREVCNAGVDRLNDNYSFTGIGFASSSTPFDQSSSNFCGTEPYGIGLGNSKYLKAAQSLLGEVISISSKEVESSNEKYVRRLYPDDKRGSLTLRFELKAELCHNDLLSMEKLEFQARLTKLIALLEETERRFEQYYHHMEEIVSSFEAIVGLGAGKSYTALALQAMSRHFCSLRDAIISQIYETRRKFSQDMPRIATGLSQMSLFNRENRHNRFSLQQLGMIQSQRQAWRPIRGLPETSVSILRSWLFEHFLHPYPNDNEKLVLASQTGLTKNQVSNWFINARVRLWKPMIEEMYKEEFADLVE